MWRTRIICALGRWKLEDQAFEAGVGTKSEVILVWKTCFYFLIDFFVCETASPNVKP